MCLCWAVIVVDMYSSWAAYFIHIEWVHVLISNINKRAKVLYSHTHCHTAQWSYAATHDVHLFDESYIHSVSSVQVHRPWFYLDLQHLFFVFFTLRIYEDLKRSKLGDS